MTDRTHPDSGRATGAAHIIRYALELGLLWVDGDGRDKVREAFDALDTLESQLEAVGAGGVQALSAAPAGFVPVSAFDRLHAHAESLAARLLAASAEQAAPKAEPGEREQAAQRLRELGGISPDDVTDPLHPRYIEGYKAGHAAGRKREAPQQEAQEPAFWMNEKGHTWSHSDWKQFPKHRAKYPIPLYPHFPAPQPAPAPLSDDAKDAARYRWLRDFHHGDVQDELPYIAAGEGYDGAWALTGEDADKEIDAAIAAQGGKV